MNENMFSNPELIHAYSRVQAIQDGVLIDVTKTAREIGFKAPVAVTSTVWNDCVQWDAADSPQNESFRLWNLLFNAALAAHASGTRSRCAFMLLRVPRNASEVEEVTLTLHIGPGDTPAPVLTIMMPDED